MHFCTEIFSFWSGEFQCILLFEELFQQRFFAYSWSFRNRENFQGTIFFQVSVSFPRTLEKNTFSCKMAVRESILTHFRQKMAENAWICGNTRSMQYSPKTPKYAFLCIIEMFQSLYLRATRVPTGSYIPKKRQKICICIKILSLAVTPLILRYGKTPS